MAVKDAQLNIRTSPAQKAKLAHAARVKNMNVSQFVLHKSLEAADEIIADQLIIKLCAEDYDDFVARLEEPPRDIPKLRELFETPSILEK
jgi:uncharacterized protein (DUF1778 family)